MSLQTQLSAVLINDVNQQESGYLKKPQQKALSHYPYPNPIKLLSREKQKEIKGEYLNAEMMHQGVALPISDIRPDGNIESEIFPPELTKEAQNKEVFTPPNHQQMKFMTQEEHDHLNAHGGQAENDQGFFITEGQNNAIKEENESDQEQ